MVKSRRRVHLWPVWSSLEASSFLGLEPPSRQSEATLLNSHLQRGCAVPYDLIFLKELSCDRQTLKIRQYASYESLQWLAAVIKDF